MTRDGEPRYPEVCAAVVTSIKATLEADLAGLYLHGSFVTGDFNERRSDLDFLAILHRDPVDDDIPRLTEMHDAIVARYPGWIDRVEVAYLSAKAIQAFREARHPIAVISPGEPLNLKEAGSEWLINWYIARTFGLTIAGPPAADLIPLITHEEYVATARQQARDWADRVPGITGDPGLSYAVLSACRAMYTCDTGEQASKTGAAKWAERRFPDHAGLIERALGWPGPASERVFPQPISLREATSFISEVNAHLERQ